MKLLNNGHLDIGNYGSVKLSFDKDGDSDIIKYNPDDVNHPVFHIRNSKGEDLGWIGLYDTKHSRNLVFTEEDKKSLIKALTSIDEDCSVSGRTIWTSLCKSYYLNFNECERSYYYRFKNRPMPDYNNL